MKGAQTSTKNDARNARLGLWALGLVALAGVLLPGTKALIGLVPLMSFVLALYLSKTFCKYYTALVCWLFFLSPLLRRLIEFRTGSPTASFVMISPYLACFAGLSVLHHRWNDVLTVRLRSWHYLIGVICYGFIVGVFAKPSLGLIQDTFGWVSPIIFALYVYAQREQVRKILDALETSFVYGIAFLSLYAMYQFFFLPPWDALWMENSTLTSIGLPEPMQVRLFSTMNTPQPFANYLVAGILFSISSKLRIRFVTISLGTVALGLTLSRSGWVGALIGIFYLGRSTSTRKRLQMIIGLCVCVLLFGAMTRVPEVNQLLTQRLESFSDLKGDGSANDRLISQTEAISLLKSSPFGMGLGADALDNKGPSYGVARPTGITIADNGIEEIMLPFGWAGSLIFIIGFSGTVLSCF